MDELVPCPHCGNADAPSVHTYGANHFFVWCDTNYGGCSAQAGPHVTEANAIAAWNRRAPAPPDPALLALARFGALMCRDAQWPDDDPVGYQDHCEQIDLSAPEVRRLMDEAGLRVDRDGTPEPGVRAAIARLLAPDGADGAGEVADA